MTAPVNPAGRKLIEAARRSRPMTRLDAGARCRQNVYMTNTTRTYGYLYNRDATVTDCAASIRRTIKTLTKGDLLPADWTYRVRTHKYAGGASIEVSAYSPRPVFACEPDRYDFPHVRHGETGEIVTAYADRFTIEATSVRLTLEELHDAHNHDGSDSMTDYFDVKFYGQVVVTTEAGVDKIIAGE